MDKIKADLVFEILGRPVEHIKNALISVVDKLGAEKGIKVNEKKLHEPTEVKESKDLHTAFAEVSAEFDSLENLLGVLFAYMPAHVEIVSPAKFEIPNTTLNDINNKLLARLHNYDSITKKFIYERDFLLNKLREVAPHLFKKIERRSGENLEDKTDSKKKQDNAQEKPTPKRKKSKK